MSFAEFYDIAEYGNEAWRGAFTPKEIACNAYDYWCEFKASRKQSELTHSMKELCKLLSQDGSEQCLDWLYMIASETGIIDMDFMDFVETDGEIIKRFLAE